MPDEIIAQRRQVITHGFHARKKRPSWFPHKNLLEMCHALHANWVAEEYRMPLDNKTEDLYVRALEWAKSNWDTAEQHYDFAVRYLVVATLVDYEWVCDGPR